MTECTERSEGREGMPVDMAMTVLCEVVIPGIQTTVQDLPGRAGLWGVGVPPSGAWDDLSFALANQAVGNAADAAGLEAVLRGPKLRFAGTAVVCLAGAATAATVDGAPVPLGEPVTVHAGQVLDLGPAKGPGLRSYLAVRGGLAVPSALGSRSTFLLGGFGGHEGRALAKGDVLHTGTQTVAKPSSVVARLPQLRDSWELRVIPGPHGAPEHFRREGIEEMFAAEWRVDHRADRTGVRLVGPAPQWARTDGGDAGLHPSNIHDSAYPVGGIMVSGDTPVVVGPDGPSLGGFVVAAVVIRADRWQLAQARPGDRIRLVPVTPEQADAANADRRQLLAPRATAAQSVPLSSAPLPPGSPQLVSLCSGRRPAVLLELPAEAGRPALTVRRAGDHHVLVEAGPPALDLAVRLRIHLLAEAVRDDAVVEAVEGVRSLLLAVDEQRLSLPELAARIGTAWTTLPDPRTVELPAREVTMPIAFDDPSVHEAMQRYQTGVRPDAPWCPDNVEFIRRVNGLEQRSDVFDIITAASYLVVGLGDVYLGAPVAVPLDPQHRLVTTKYNPPRTWTPANAVGIGGVYLCVYGMEGPGGYQLFGRTVPVWRYNPGSAEPPWLLRQFDILRFTSVTAERLQELRADIAAGRADLETKPVTLRLADLLEATDSASAGTGEGGDFTSRRIAAFAAERNRWELAATESAEAVGAASAGAVR